MELLRSIDTPWAVHALSFSPDGEELALGGGGYYGPGGVLRIPADLKGSALLTFPADDERPRRPAYTTSGLVYTHDGRRLLVSSRASAFRNGPLWELKLGDGCTEIQRRWDFQTSELIGDGYATGLATVEGGVVVRHNASHLDEVLRHVELEDAPSAVEYQQRQHLAHARLVVEGTRVWTGGGGSRELWAWSATAGSFDPSRATAGLLRLDLDSGVQEEIPTPGSERTTAISIRPDASAIITGGLHGEVDLWPLPDGPTRRLAGYRPAPAVAKEDRRWTTYCQLSVVGICHLADGARWVSVDAGGSLCLWEADELLWHRRLPAVGSPRSLAAHPYLPWVVVGLKSWGKAGVSSQALLLNLE